MLKSVLFIATDLAYGGAETQVASLAIGLRARDWEVRVVSLMSPKAYVKELQAAGIPVVSLGIRRKSPNPQPVLRLVRLIREWRPHIVHSHMVHANILTRLLRVFTPIPVLICTVHNTDERGRKGSGKVRTLLYRITDPLCDLTTQVSIAGLERYVQIRAVPKHKIKYMPNGVDIRRFSPNPETRMKTRKELGFNQEFVWLAVGRFDPPKDYSTMFYAFARVGHRYPDAHLLIAGEGPLRLSLEILAQNLNINHRIHFLGIRRDIPHLMNASNAYVMSSAWEGMPMVLLEASATGLPTVATDVGGNREVVLDGVTGFLVPPKDPEALAQAMLRVMALSPEERRKMGEAARQHIEANFSLDRVVDQWEALYRELLEKKALKR